MTTTRNRIFLLILGVILTASFFAAPLQGAGAMSLSLFGGELSEAKEDKPAFTPSEKHPFSALSQAVKNYAAVNPEVKGWLLIPGTNMNYPVVLNNSSNNHYLYRDWKGNNYPQITWQNWASYPESATYMDYRSKVGDTWATSSKNVVLYGHNWTNLRTPFAIGSNEANDRNHKMFAQLQSYMSMDFTKANPHMYYSTATSEGVWRVFAVGYTEVTPLFYYNNPNPTREQQQAIADEWKQRSIYNFGVEVNGDDRLLILTTCTRHYGSTPHQRFVVVARMLRPGESDKDAVTITANPNVRQPDFTRPVTVTQLLAQQAAAAQAATQGAVTDTGNTGLSAGAAQESAPAPAPETSQGQSAAGPSFFDNLN